jgi:hypothetical protein
MSVSADPNVHALPPYSTVVEPVATSARVSAMGEV